jgi:transketolase
MSNVPETLVYEIKEHARQLRIDSLKMICRRGAGHPGGALSCAEIMAALFFYKLHLDPKNPEWPERDRFILSKGHASAILYACLARRGFFPMEDLERWGDLDCHLQGHPDRLKTPGVEMTTGLLGHGIAIGVGMALGVRTEGNAIRIYTLLGDGECQAGIVWEGAMAAAKYKTAELTAIVDYNGVQLDGFVQDIMPLEPFVAKWRSFGWEVLEIDGHDARQVIEALDAADKVTSGPAVIVARTVKGKGVSFMENDCRWHGLAPNQDQLQLAITELEQGAKK